MVCHIANTDRYHPLHVRLDSRTQTTGVIMADQVCSLDVASGEAKYIQSAPEDIIREVMDIALDILRPADTDVSYG